MPVATLAAFTSTHNGHAILGFRANGLDPSPQAETVLVAELAAIVLLAATFVTHVAEPGGSSGVRALATAGAVTGVLFVGFGWYSAQRYETTEDANGPTSVAIADFAFTPHSLTVPRGATVTWTNVDAIDHSIVATDQSFASGAFGSRAEFQLTLDSPGTHTYVCGIHPEMTGTITVTA